VTKGTMMIWVRQSFTVSPNLLPSAEVPQQSHPI
jgi:hypothetical protein